MGLYFEGRIVSDAKISKLLLTDDPTAMHIGNRIWLFQNQKTGKTIITGDEGNGWCVKLTEGESEEEAIAKLKDKREKNEVFTGFVKEILKKYPDAI
jgi:hypothetical protein